MEKFHSSDCSCKELKNRLEKSRERILQKLEDKDLNNIYFLILYELPYIFSDGKILAGFDALPEDGKLIKQPLNTLHLTERVIKRKNGFIRDHFKTILNAFTCNGKRLSHVSAGIYELDTYKSGDHDLIEYCGMINVQKNPLQGQYIDKNRVTFYLLKILLKCKEYKHLYIIWSNGEKTIDDGCLRYRYNKLKEIILKRILSTRLATKSQEPIEPYCKVSEIKPLIDTMEFGSIEKHFYRRVYIDEAIDELQRDITEKLKNYGTITGDTFRAILLRTKKPDANYLVIHVTPKMCKAIYDKIGGPEIEVDKQLCGLKKEFRGYIENKPNAPEWQSYCTANAIRKIGNDCEYTKTIDQKAIDRLQECHRYQCSTETCSKCEKLEDSQKKLYLTFLVKTAMEYTPLVAGVAYEIGKRGVPDYSYGWQSRHPFMKRWNAILDSHEKSLRYPDYFQNFIDKKILKDFDMMLDIPLIFKGKVFGIFVIYPDMKFGVLPDVLSDMMDAIEHKRLDIFRAFFLDFCANIIHILSTGSKLDAAIKKVEDLIKYAHGIPRTKIIANKEKVKEIIEELFFWDTNADDLVNALTARYEEDDETLKYYRKYLLRKPLEGENLFAERWYVSHKLLKLEKDSKFLLLQIYPSPKDNPSLREALNSLYLAEAIETGLKAFEKKQEIIKHGTRAAAVAIMSRNLSHNIGSHVLSRWVVELKGKLPTDDYDKLKEEKDRHTFNSCNLFQYLQHRMDFIAEVSTSVPCSEMTMDFQIDVLNPMLGKFPGGKSRGISQAVLLENIAASEGFNDLKDKFSINIPADCKKVSIPNGMIGIHALFSILENFIRNSAKHYSGEHRNEFRILMELKIPDRVVLKGSFPIRNGLKEKLEFNDNCLYLKKNIDGMTSVITHAEQEDILNLAGSDEDKISLKRFFYANERYIELMIWDLRNESCNHEILSDLRSYLDIEKGRGRYLNEETGSIEPEGWGFKEMTTAANFLRKYSTENLIEQIGEKEPRLMEILCGDDPNSGPCCASQECPRREDRKNRLAIKFYLRKPKDMAIITQKEVFIKKDKFEIAKLDSRDFHQIPHRLLMVDRNLMETYVNNPKAPMRILSFDDSCNVLDDDYYLEQYEAFVTKIINDNQKLPLLGYIGGDEKGLCQKGADRSFIGRYISNGDNEGELIFYRHMEDTNSNAYEIFKSKRYFQPVSAAYPFALKLASLPRDVIIQKHFLLELIESALTSVLIIDERVSDYAKKAITMGNNGTFERIKLCELLKKMNISVMDVNKDNINWDSMQRQLGEFGQRGHDFLVIHQGILDKMEKLSMGCSVRFMKEVNCRWKVIDSGRGVPTGFEHYPGTRFVEVSALLKMLETYDKHSLVQTLFSLRRPDIKEYKKEDNSAK